MKYSRQRELVRRTVMQHLIHPTADTVYSLVREEEPNISLGTVYRNLNLLVEQGAILKIPLPNASDRFDGRTDRHQHLLCSHCGKVFDVEMGKLLALEEQIQQISGFTVTGYQLMIEGICSDCQHSLDHQEKDKIDQERGNGHEPERYKN